MVLSFGEVLMDCFPDKKVIGGAPFNVAVHLQRLGEDSGIITKIGKDGLGLEVREILEREGLANALQVDSEKPTGRVDVTLNNGQPSYEIHKNCGWEFIEFAHAKAPVYFVFGSLALYFSNNKEAFLKYRSLFSSTTFLCDLNLRSPFYDQETIELCLSSADILKINDEELDYLAQTYNQKDVILLLKEKFNITKVLLTRGADGATLYWENETYESNVKKIDFIKDTVGAGDSFTALFLYGLIKKQNLDETLARASEFASIICQTAGAVPNDLSVYNSYKL